MELLTVEADGDIKLPLGSKALLILNELIIVLSAFLITRTIRM